ncbi:MAG: Fe-S cluster assembly protein SufD [Aphanothece sp. CMT-3BRIN-NPC111]|jgi:Fe-S cluster assembly protein SufD|nr:Fe-S cluster assembly protein SufD [Aphanothece sp. CMT-3BRIN-NPC111]
MSIQVSPKLQVSYLAQLLNQRPDVPAISAKTAELEELRQGATALVQELAIPTTRDEDWRFTDLSPLLKVNFVTASPASFAVDATSITLPEAAQSRLVFVNGCYAPDLSSVANLADGVFVGNLLTANIPEIRDYLAKQQGGQEVFTALNTASLTDAAVVYIPRNLVVETPIHLVFISVAGELPTISQPRCLVVAEPGSSVTIIEEYRNRKDAKSAKEESREGVYFTNSVTEVWVEENAQVSHTRIQQESEAGFHIGKSAIAQARNSRYTCHAISLGGQISRHNLDIFQTGEGTETTLNGLTMIAGEQLADTHSAIALNYPYSKSRQLHKCIVGDRAHAVFNGKVFVPKPAQLTDAGQLSRNLLLSPKARVDTKPQLEITADNVKCAHGATVSQLEADEIFYLQSRGLDADSARTLLINAFATEVIEQIPITSMREKLSQMVRQKQ